MKQIWSARNQSFYQTGHKNYTTSSKTIYTVNIGFGRWQVNLYYLYLTALLLLLVLINPAMLSGGNTLDSLHQAYLKSDNASQKISTLYYFADIMGHIDKDSSLLLLQKGMAELEEINKPSDWEEAWRERYAIEIIRTYIRSRRHDQGSKFLDNYELTATEKGWPSLWESKYVGHLYVTMAFSFFIQRDFDKSTDYVQRANKIADSTNDLELLAMCKLYYASFLTNNQEDFTEAKQYFLESLALYEELNDHYGSYNILFNLILSLNYKKNYQTAYEYLTLLKQKRQLIDPLPDLELQILSQEIKALTGLKKFKEAEQLLEQFGSNLATMTPLEKWNYYNEKYRLHAMQGNFEAALDNYKEYWIVLDSIRSSQRKMELLEIQEKLNLQKVEFEKKTVQQENAYLKRQNRILTLNAILVILISILAIIAAVLYYRRKKQKQEDQNLELQHKLLQLQMNPHFFFNTLSVIPGLILQDKKEEALELLENVGVIFREALVYSRERLINLQSEIHFIEAYLRLYQLYSDHKFSYSIDIDENINIAQIQLPPFLIQPLVENAFKHGKIGKGNGGTISLRFHVENNILRVAVENQSISTTTDSFSDSEKGTGLSLKIIKQRIKLMFRNKGKLEVTPLINGFRSQLEFPVNLK